MKNINIALEDSEYESLMKAKKELTWKEYMMKEVRK